MRMRKYLKRVSEQRKRTTMLTVGKDKYDMPVLMCNGAEVVNSYTLNIQHDMYGQHNVKVSIESTLVPTLGSRHTS